MALLGIGRRSTASLLSLNPNAALIDSASASMDVENGAQSSDASRARNGTSFSTERVNMFELALEGKPHGELLCRVGVDLYTKTWRPCFCVFQNGAILIFREKADFVDYVFNPYIDDAVRRMLIRAKLLAARLSCGPVVTKRYNGVTVPHFKISTNRNLVAKLGGPERLLNSFRSACNSAEASF